MLDNVQDHVNTRHVFAISGPTASGKSALALAIAEAVGGEIVNADALQVYNAFSVLSARPDDEDLARAPHHLYGHVSTDDEYSVGKWLLEVEAVLFKSSKPLIFVGGTGLYFKALMHGFAEIPAISESVKAEVSSLIETRGILGAQSHLAAIDPISASRIDLQNPRRVERALHVFLQTRKPIAIWQDETPAPLLPLSEFISIRVTPDREYLYSRINERAKLMLDTGAIEEVAAILDEYDPSMPAFRAIGVAEIVEYLTGSIDRTMMLDRLAQETRNYAKRQFTWMRQNMREWQYDFRPEIETVTDILHRLNL